MNASNKLIINAAITGMVPTKNDSPYVPVTIDAVGTVQALNTVTIRTQVDGRLLRLAFTEGQDVKKDEVLAEIDPALYKAQYDQAVAKKAQDEATALTRTKLRQASWWRRIITPRLLQDGEIDKSLDTDEPRKIVPIEPDSRAYTLPFRGTGRQRVYNGRNAEVHFGMVMSEVLIKNKFELMTYPYDIKQVLSDNMVMDMADEEDATAYLALLNIITANPTQTVDIAGPLDRGHFARAGKYFANNRLPMGKVLMTDSLKYDLLELEATNVGDEVASQQYADGVQGVDKVFGFPVISTIKADILPPDEIWFFAPENFLGKSFLLQDATLFVKQEGPIHTMYTYESIGSLITNSRSVFRIRVT